MREDSDGRGTVSPWGDAREAPAYAMGERVYGAIDGCPGTVVSAGQRTFTVQWAGENAVGGVTYPADTIMVRKAWPWEN